MEVEHHLRRGRPLAAFNSLLSTRVHNLGSYTPQPGRQSFYDSSNLLSSLTDSEESLIVSVRCYSPALFIIVLRIFLIYFEDSSCVIVG